MSETGRVTAIQADLAYTRIEIRVTGLQADLTYDEMTSRVTAIQAGLTYSEKTARVTGLHSVTTHSVSGTDLGDPGARITAIHAALTRPIHHHINYEVTGAASEVEYTTATSMTLEYEAPLDDTTFIAKEAPPRGGEDPQEE